MTKDIVKKVAELSRLRFSEEELEKFTEEFSNIVSFVEMINELDTSGVEPSPYPINIINEPREDIVVESGKVEDMLKNSPKRKSEFIVVPKVIEK
ncbi:MAG: Asp-tRNA(Asn)/Glu-tRNA(Gln) amidotransferase subunit GatC [Spirochaetia bacterium]|nr:Asp-tRNA(Asn)/Glu-tRNA(Gln) amidotransferase subunit GatC [Spirochaetota bacterium]MCX8097212.1 Asp-tRNA(Asn)/Glu-tRNA(Gln) amidotransferase subunit GatC [Spirochaetota bacterium]MDW8111966.1 Asp-tRNA(Asn)/Glu-tRNA(Gln) amidotransferase subunit GatC [Spirochaetia bacterium]